MVEHARFCSECGTWVVHAVAGLGPGFGSSMPPAQSPSAFPPVPPIPSPSSPGFSPVQPAELAGTLPASAAMLAALTHKGQPPTLDDLPAASQTFREAAPPSQMSIKRPAGATQVKTLDTGRPPPPDATPTREEKKLKTVVDERPPVSPSLSLGRTPRPLGAFLVSYQYEPLGTFWPLAIGTNLIGRSGSGRPDIDVGIADTTVSSEQAVLEVDARGLTVEDRGSRNGTSVNGRAISAGVRVPVVHGDRVKFGSFETIVVLVPYPAGA